MGRKFEIPDYYRSGSISELKKERQLSDARKQDLSPSVIKIGKITFKIARHFGFCFGVQNAIEIAYKAIAENPQQRVFLLSEMIHNPHVNQDLLARGVKFILATDGSQLIAFEDLKPNDIVIVPAFGTTIELLAKLTEVGINPMRYNATCPFVEKVWKRSSQLGEKGYTIIIHGKHYHEETRATFSHAREAAPALVIKDMSEAKLLAEYINQKHPASKFATDFKGRFSEKFDPENDLKKIGVVNQTTMLAYETQAITDYLKTTMINKYGSKDLELHFADTRDTLCYATSENQDAVTALVKSGGDLALVVGGYNSSNTFHLAKLCSQRVPTFYISDANEIINADKLRHLNLDTKTTTETANWLKSLSQDPIILVTAGASCPDAVVQSVIEKVAALLNN